METNINQGNNQGLQMPVPNSTAVLVLGIISIVLCCCYGVVGLICGIIALVLAKKAKEAYTANPDLYTASSLKNVNAGKICAWIGVALSSLYLILTIWLYAMLGWAALQDPTQMQDRMREMFGQ